MKYLRRGIWYLVTRLLVVCLVAGLLITVFYYAYNVANIRVIVKDGMEARAKYILGMTDVKAMDRYFEDPVDPAREREIYADYDVRDLYHRISNEFIWVWPWETTTTITVTESVPRIDGRVKADKGTEVTNKYGSDATYPPKWEETTYRVRLEKKAGQWKIVRLTPVSRE